MKMKAKFELDMDEAILICFALKELINAPYGLIEGEIDALQHLYAKIVRADYEFIWEEDE